MKRGDRVRCIRGYNFTDVEGVQEGRVYIIKADPGPRSRTVQVVDAATGRLVDLWWSLDRFVPEPVKPPVTLNPFEWDSDALLSAAWSATDSLLDNIIAWACFCYWVVEAPVVWRPTRTVMVELPKDVAEWYAGRPRHGDQFTPRSAVVREACRRALEVGS